MYGVDLVDTRGDDGDTILLAEAFSWLVSFQPGYLVYRLGNHYVIKLYIPSRFARQFGYDQLYIGNPSLELA